LTPDGAKCKSKDSREALNRIFRREMSKPKLSDQQKRFCDNYLLCMNATEAAIQASYSPATAAQSASRLLSKVNIREYIDERRKQEEELVGISRAKNLRQLSMIVERSLEPEIVFDMWGNPIFRDMLVEVEVETKTKRGKKKKEIQKQKIRAVMVKHNPKAATAALAEINKMLGYHAPTKIKDVTENPLASLANKLFGKAPEK